MSGDTVIVGAYGDDTPAGTDAGSAYVFTRSGGVWTLQQKLTVSDAAAGDIFGFSLSTVYRGSASLTISNFAAPVPPNGNGVPETGSALNLFALGFVGLLAYRVAAGRRDIASAS